MVVDDCFYCSLTMSNGCARCNFTGFEPPSDAQVREMVGRARQVIREEDAMAQKEHLVWCQLWTMRDIDRPERHQICTLHASDAKRKEFVKRYHKEMPDNPPSVYFGLSRANGSIIPPYRCKLDERTYERIINSDIGLWCVSIPPETTHAIALIPPTDFMPFHEGLTR